MDQPTPHPQQPHAPTTPTGAGFIPPLLGLAALLLYTLTASPVVFPGLPAYSLAAHLGLTHIPPINHTPWGCLLRLLDHLPGSVNTWATALSILGGAFCVWSLALLVGRVRPSLGPPPNDPPHESSRARRLAALVAGLFTLFSMPVWFLSTRALPDILDLALLLLTTLLFSEYQRAGQTWRLCLFGALYGLGITLSESFILFAPLAAVLLLRAMLQRGDFRVQKLALTALCTLPPLLLYPLYTAILWHHPNTPLLGYPSPGRLLLFGILRSQWAGIFHGQPLHGLFLMLTLTLLPWIVLFLFRPKNSARRLPTSSLLLRWFILLALLGALFNLPYAPWNFTRPPQPPAPLPYLLMAASLGMIASDFSLIKSRRASPHFIRSLHALSHTTAFLLPPILLAAGAYLFPIANGRAALRLSPFIQAAFDALQHRDILLASGPFDDLLRLQARSQAPSLKIISLPAVHTPAYRSWLAKNAFTDPRSQSLLSIGFTPFLRELLSSKTGLSRTAALGFSEPLRDYGTPVPDRILYRAIPPDATLDLRPLLPLQTPFRTNAFRLAAHPLPSRNPLAPLQSFAPRLFNRFGPRCKIQNPLAPFEQHALLLASKIANDIGFIQAEQGSPTNALLDFADARRLCPRNISALLNQISITETLASPDFQTFKAEWEALDNTLSRRDLWNLGPLYGYVYNSPLLASRGMLFAISGKPRLAEAEFRHASGTTNLHPHVKAFLARAYLQSGETKRGEAFYQDILANNPRDINALHALAHLALAQGRLDDAQQKISAIEALAPSPQAARALHRALRFDHALLLFAQGKHADATAALQSLLDDTPDDTRAWALLADILSADHNPDHPLYKKAITALRAQAEKAPHPNIRFILADLHFRCRQYAAARDELASIERMNPSLPAIYERYLRLDRAEHRQDLAEDHAQTLLALDPHNYLANYIMASFQLERGQYALAESSYRAAIAAQRAPDALNDLACLLLLRATPPYHPDALSEPLRLASEALAAAPKNPTILSTHAEILTALGRLDEAEANLHDLLQIRPDDPPSLLLASKIYEAKGNTNAALSTASALAKRRPELLPHQQDELDALLRRLHP